MKLSKRRTAILLLFILSLAFFVRIFRITTIPSGFFCDEAERGVSAYSLIKTGKDWHEKPFPIFFEAFGEYTPPIQIYSMVLPVAIFGLNEFSVRVTSVLWGTAAVLLIFYLGTILFSQEIGLWAALFLALQPWTLHYSRYGGEIMVYMALFLFALTLSLQALKKERIWLFAFLIWGLTFYTYNPSKLITPLFLISFLILNLSRIKVKKKYFRQGLGIFAITSFPFLLHMISGAGFVRFQQVSIFSVNKPLTEKVWLFLTKYIMQFSPALLFLGKEPTVIARHFTKGLTPLLLIQAILIPLGIIFLLRNSKNKNLFLILLWFVFYPIAGALTASGPLSSRSIIGAPLWALFSSCGVVFLKKELAKKQRNNWLSATFSLSIFITVLLNFFSFYSFYLNEYPKRAAGYWGWQYGPREIVNYFKKVEKQYDELIMSGRFNAPEIFFKFYAPEGCKKCKIGDANSYKKGVRQLFALAPEELMGLKYEIHKIIYYPNGRAAFKIVELKQ